METEERTRKKNLITYPLGTMGRDAVYALYSGVCAFSVRVVGIGEARQCSGGGEVGFGFLLLQEGGGLRLVAAEHSFVETRAGQRAVE